MRIHHLAIGLLLLAAPASAQDKGGGFEDLFGDSLSGAKQDMSELEKAASDVKVGGTESGLTVKGSGKAGAGKVKLMGVFGAARVVITKKEGCIPGGRGRIKITSVDVDEVPAKSPSMSICVKMSSRSNREMRVTLNVIDARKKRAAHAESVANFTGITRQDLVLDFPSMPLHAAGQYYVSVDVDGKTVGKLPLFVVNTASGSPAAAPTSGDGVGDASDEL